MTIFGTYSIQPTLVVLFGIWGALPASGQDAPAHLTFEVASIKPASTDPGPAAMAGAGGRGGAMMQDMMERMRQGRRDAAPPGLLPKEMDRARVTLRGLPLVDLVAAAYRVRRTQVSGPAWMAEMKFDIDAKIPEGSTPESVYPMLQSLLEDRFSMKFHREERELPGFALLVAKNGPKLTAATPAEPDSAKDDATPMSDEARQKVLDDLKKRTEAVARNLNPAEMMSGMNTQQWSKKDATMAELAAHLGTALHAAVVDMTSLTGKYIVDLLIQQSAADSPEYGASQAVAKFGLKLEQHKIPTTVLAIDNIAKAPTEN
jgi:uncharacterized protein (TIGR03435 family)